MGYSNGSLVTLLARRLKVYAFATLVVAFCLVFLRHCKRHDDTVLADKTSLVLKENEVGKFVIHRGGTTLLRQSDRDHGKTPNSRNIRDYGRLSVLTVKQDPITKETKLEVWSPTHGFVVEPAIALAYSDRLRGGVDVQLFYWRNCGLDVGLVSDRKFNSFRGYCGVSYRVYSNTSLFIGEDSRRTPIFGAKVEF